MTAAALAGVALGALGRTDATPDHSQLSDMLVVSTFVGATPRTIKVRLVPTSIPRVTSDTTGHL